MFLIPVDRLEEYKEAAAHIEAQPPELAAVLHYLHAELLKLRHPELNPPAEPHLTIPACSPLYEELLDRFSVKK